MISNVVFCGHILLKLCVSIYLKFTLTYIYSNYVPGTMLNTSVKDLCTQEFSGEAKCKQVKYDINTSI